MKVCRSRRGEANRQTFPHNEASREGAHGGDRRGIPVGVDLQRACNTQVMTNGGV